MFSLVDRAAVVPQTDAAQLSGACSRFGDKGLESSNGRAISIQGAAGSLDPLPHAVAD
jgi:hypothetical protein